MDEYNKIAADGQPDDTAYGTKGQGTSTENEIDNGEKTQQGYSYKSDQIIQDSVYDQAEKTDSNQYSQQYTYQTGQNGYSQGRSTYGNSYGSNTYGGAYGGYSTGNYGTKQTAYYTPQTVAASSKKEKRTVTLGVVAIFMAIAVAVSSVVSLVIYATLSSYNKNNGAIGSTNTETTIIQSNVEMSTVEAVATAVTPSVVCIEVNLTVQNNSYNPFFGGYGSSQTQQSTGYGSGVIYSTDGYIITNYHVIGDIYSSSVINSEIKVYLNESSDEGIKASVVGYNSAADLAVLKINKTGLPAAEIGDSSTLRIGQTVIAIGNPGGIEFAGSVTSGVISGLDRKLTVDSVTMSLIQTDAAINPGNSGGALVDASGRLVGIPNVKISADGYEGMGFCIPVNTAVEICNNIINNGMNGNDSDSAPYLGVEVNNSFTGGAYIAAVTEGGPAEVAGIKSGDIIISFDGTKISGYTDLVNAINSHKAGDKVEIMVYRNGAQKSISVTLGSNG